MSPRIVQRLVYLLVHSSVLTAAFEANITIPPQSVNISLNGVAEFNCTGIADVFQWMANGIELMNNGETIVIPPQIVVNQTQGIRMSALQLTALSSLAVNATNITCTAIRVSPLSTDVSEPAVLLVQDPLVSVSNLTVNFINSTTVFISWSPPFTLEGVPILGYNVTISINGEKEVVLILEDITELYYSIGTFLENDLVVTVVPINEGGTGKAEVMTFNYPLHTTSNVIKTSKDIQSTLYVQESAIPKMNSSPMITSAGSVYVTISSTKVQFTILLNSSDNVTPSSNMIPNASENVTVSVLLLALIGVSTFAVVVILLSVTVTVACCCRHKTRTIIIKSEKTPPRDVALPVSDNPAYKLVTVVKDHQKEGNTSHSTTNNKELFPDYEEIEEVYFKHTVEEDDNNSACHGFYEPVECH